MAEIALFPLTAPAALKLIREIAADSSRVVVVAHGKKRGKQRNINTRQVVDCLLKGTITEGPYQIADGSWRCNVFRHSAGERMTCVVEFDLPEGLLVITVFRG